MSTGDHDSPRDPALLSRLAELFGLALDAPHFEQALTHPSYANEREVTDNQRLEFLGDAVLGFCASEELYRRFPDADEGTLTRLRSQVVNAEALASWALAEALPDALRLGRGAGAAGLRVSTNVLADAVEALIAAAFLDSGLDAARRACTSIVDHHLNALEPVRRDPKSELQERLQARGAGRPQYEVIETRGPAHDRSFTVRVHLDERALGVGEGRSRRAAERAAALAALGSEATESARPEADADCSTGPDPGPSS